MRKKCVLTIAGSDSSGGAGIQADLKTMSALGVYGMSAVTSLTAQNTTGVYGILDCTPDMLKKQIDCVFTDIYPDAVKIGMVSSVPLIETIAEGLLEHKAENIVLDPVMVSTSGSRLLSEDAIDALVAKLFPLAALITPNIPEAEVLSGVPIRSRGDMEQAVDILTDRYQLSAVLLKGGHSVSDADDLFFEMGKCTWITGRRIVTDNTHGTGCTLSSAIASNLAFGYAMQESVRKAKDYISGALAAGLELGQGCGPLWHFWNQQKQ